MSEGIFEYLRSRNHNFHVLKKSVPQARIRPAIATICTSEGDDLNRGDLRSKIFVLLRGKLNFGCQEPDELHHISEAMLHCGQQSTTYLLGAHRVQFVGDSKTCSK